MGDPAKFAVIDDRLLQSPPSYAILKGALNVNILPTNATTFTQSSQIFTIRAPFEGCFLDRLVWWKCPTHVVAELGFHVGAVGPGPTAVAIPLLQPGANFSLADFPNTRLINSLVVQINDASVSSNVNENFDMVKRLITQKKSQAMRLSPCMMDRFAYYDAAAAGGGYLANPLASYNSQVDASIVPNGAWAGIGFTNVADGALFTPNQVILNYGGVADLTVTADEYGIPSITQVPGAWTNSNRSLKLGIKYESTEAVWISPLVYDEIYELTTGLVGVDTLTFTFNMQTPDAGRILKMQSIFGSAINYGTQLLSLTYSSNPFEGTPTLYTLWMTAGLTIPRAPTNTVPYMNLQRWQTIVGMTGGSPIYGSNPRSSQLVTTSVILSQIPDLIAVTVQPPRVYYDRKNAGMNPFALPDAAVGIMRQTEWMFPISKVEITFNNRTAQLSTLQIQHLFQMSVRNGLCDCDFLQYGGQVIGAGATRQTTAAAPLLIRPTDWGLDEGQAPGLNGSWSIQITVYVDNYQGVWNGANFVPYSGPVNLNMFVFQSGFFQTRAGQSKYMLAPLSETDVLTAPMASAASRTGLERLVGGAWWNLGNLAEKFRRAYDFGKKAVDVAKTVAPAVSGAMRAAAPESRVTSAVNRVLSRSGLLPEMAGAGMSRHSVASRLR